MNHYNTTTFTWNVNEGMQIVIVVLYCHINSITIVILVLIVFTRNPYGSKIYIHLINILLHNHVRASQQLNALDNCQWALRSTQLVFSPTLLDNIDRNHPKFSVAFFNLTRLFSVLHRFSIGLRSGLCEGHSNTFTLLSRSHFLTTCAVCLGSLSCWKIQLRPSFNFLAEDLRLCINISRYCSFRIIPSTFWSWPVPAEAKYPHNMILPLPCFSVGMVLFGWNASPSFRQT